MRALSVLLGNSCVLRSGRPVFGQVPPLDESIHRETFARSNVAPHVGMHPQTTGSCITWRPTGQRKSSGTKGAGVGD